VNVRHYRIACGALLVAFPMLAVPRAKTLAGPEAIPTVQPLPSPAGANSSEPKLTVQGDHALLSWLEVSGERTALKFASRTATGWTGAQTVSSGNNFFVNSYDVPSVYALRNGTIAAAWIENNGPGEDASKVMLSWSKDQGRTWSRPVSPHHDGTHTEHSFVSLFQADAGGLGVIWIDGRATDPEKETGDMSLRAATYDIAGKQLGETVIDPRVCECCSTAVAQTSEGVIAAFRNRTASEIRDIYVSRLATGAWSATVSVHNDGWHIDACPINGPAVSAAGSEVAVAWFTAKNDQGRAFVAFSHDAGRTFGPAIRVDDTASLGRLGVQMLADGSAVVTYIELADKHSQFRVRKVTPAGVRSAAVTIADTSGSRYPRVARAGDELLFSWTEGSNGSLRVRTARANALLK
jgi:hypothetical protein